MGSGDRQLKGLLLVPLVLSLAACDAVGKGPSEENASRLARASPPTPVEPTPSVDATDPAGEPTPMTRSETDVPHVRRVLGVYATPRQLHRTYVLIDAGLSDDEIVELATALHGVDPDTAYFLMDGDAGYEAMIAALPATSEGDYTDWPADYVEAHLVAYLREAIRSDGAGTTSREWRVAGGAGREDLLRTIP